MTFSFRLRDQRSRYLKSTLFSKARFYEIWFGRKCVIKKTEFPRSRKTAAQKKAYLQKELSLLIRAYLEAQAKKEKAKEKKRREIAKKKRQAEKLKKERSLALLKKKRLAEKLKKERALAASKKKEELRKKNEARKKLRAAAILNKIDKEQDRKSRKEAKKIPLLQAEIRQREKELLRLLQKEKVKEDQIRQESSKVRPTKVKKLVRVAPVETGTSKYTKEYIEKTIVSDRVSMYDEDQILEIDIRTLDFSLADPVVVISGKMAKEKRALAKRFLPHIQKFFKESRGTEQMFIFRIKYDTFVDKTRQILQHGGVGATRVHASQFSTLWESVMVAFGRLESRLGTYLGRSATKELVITGFTLENILRKKSLKQ